MSDHPSADDLTRWYATGDDREEMLTHLAACGACRRAYAEIVRSAEAPAPPLDTDAFVRRGLAVYGARNIWRRPAMWIGLTAAAASIAVFMSGALAPATFREPSHEVRGGRLVADVPAGTVSAVTELRWTSPFAGARYRVVVRNARGETVFERDAVVDRLQVPDSARFAPGTYTWTVEAFDAAGAPLGPPARQQFEVR